MAEMKPSQGSLLSKPTIGDGLACQTSPKGEFPNLRGTFLGVPIMRTIVFGGLHWGSPTVDTKNPA